MGENGGSGGSNAAVVAVLVIFVLVIVAAILVFSGQFSGRGTSSTKKVDVNVSAPAKPGKSP
jgi:hypothetical protein